MTNIKKYNKKLYSNIIKKIEFEKITLNDISNKIGVSQSAISQQLKRLADGKGVMTDTLFRIMSALDMELKDLIK